MVLENSGFQQALGRIPTATRDLVVVFFIYIKDLLVLRLPMASRGSHSHALALSQYGAKGENFLP